MKVDLFTLADAAEVGEESKLTITGAGITHIRADTLPFRVEKMASIARMILEEGDPDATRPFTLSVRWLRPDGAVIGESETVTIDPDQTRRPHVESGEEWGAFFVVRMDGIGLTDPGLHRVQLLLHGEPVAERRIVVVPPEQPERVLGN